MARGTRCSGGTVTGARCRNTMIDADEPWFCRMHAHQRPVERADKEVLSAEIPGWLDAHLPY